MAGPFMLQPPLPNLQKPATALANAEVDPALAMLSPVARDAAKAKKKKAAAVATAQAPQAPPVVSSVLS